MSILKNAVDSIQIGVEDYESEDTRRDVSAVRNIAAGILLLYKEKLLSLSPAHDKELLIKKDIRPIQTESGDILFEGRGKKTVDVQSIKERFSSLKVKVDWSRFDDINQLRNDLEHYYTSKSPAAVREIISKSFLLIRDFISNELHKDPQDLMGTECWASLLEVAEVYAAEEIICTESIDKIDWKYESISESLGCLRCPECHSSLIQAIYEDDNYPNIELNCKSCNHNFVFIDVIEQCIDDSLGGDAYEAVKNGDEPSYNTCIECDKETFIAIEKCCVACDYEMEYTSCEMCEEPLSLDEQWLEGKCSSCNYSWEKIMAE